MVRGRSSFGLRDVFTFPFRILPIIILLSTVASAQDRMVNVKAGVLPAGWSRTDRFGDSSRTNNWFCGFYESSQQSSGRWITVSIFEERRPGFKLSDYIPMGFSQKMTIGDHPAVRGGRGWDSSGLYMSYTAIDVGLEQEGRFIIVNANNYFSSEEDFYKPDYALRDYQHKQFEAFLEGLVFEFVRPPEPACEIKVEISAKRVDFQRFQVEGKVSPSGSVKSGVFTRMGAGTGTEGMVTITGGTFRAEGSLLRGMENQLPKQTFLLTLECTEGGKWSQKFEIPDCCPLCPEIFSFDGFGKDRLGRAGFETGDDIRYNTNIKKDYSGIMSDMQDAVARYKKLHPRETLYRDRKIDNSVPALSWLFAEGGVVETYSKKMVFNKTPPWEAGKMAEGSIQKEGTEPGLLASMKTLSKEKGKLNPGDVLFLALEHRKGNLNEALLLAHNTLRSLARGGDYGLTAVQRDDSFFSTHLETIRDGDNAGPWYHLYGTAFFEVESRSGLSGVRIITLMSDMGSSGIESLKSILGYETSGKSTTDIMSILANIGEQLYREKASGRVPDPEKWCFNVWGAQIASRLLAEAGEKPHSSTLSVPYRPPIASPVAKELPDGTLQDSHGHTIVMCPLKVHWKGQQGEMFFNLTNGSIQGDFPVQLIPFFESDETMGLIWQDLGDEPYDVSYEAVEDGTFRMAYVERQSQTMSVFETSVTKGEMIQVHVSDTQGARPVYRPDGRLLEPKTVHVSLKGHTPKPLPKVQSVDPSPAADSSPSETSMLIPGLLLIFLGAGALIVLLVLIVRSRSAKRLNHAAISAPSILEKLTREGGHEGWYFLSGSTQSGPVHAGYIAEQVKTGRFNPSTPVWTARLEEWVPLQDLLQNNSSRSGEQSSPDWYVMINNRQTGPVDTATLKHWLKSGQIRADFWVWREGLSSWIQVKDLDRYR